MSLPLQKPVIPTILHVLGNTGCGKTAAMELVCARNPNWVRGISVGKVLRNRYSPEYFEGQAAPQKTEVEAMQIYRDFVVEHSQPKSKVRLIIVDGQPRTTSQVTETLKPFLMKHWRHEFLLFHASEHVRIDRLADRDQSNPGALELSQARLRNDYKNTYEVLIELARLKLELQILDTSDLLLSRIARKIENAYL